MRRQGFTLTEVLIGLGLALMIALAAFEFFGITRNLFGKLKNEEVETQSAEAALDKIRIDYERAGQGLVPSMRNAAVNGVELAGQAITIAFAEVSYALSQDVLAGQVRVPLTKTSGLNASREVCLVEAGGSEVHTVASIEIAAIILGEPLETGYSMTGGELRLVERVAYFLDGPTGVLRRKVNESPAQPLLEEVADAEFRYDPAINLAGAGLTLRSGAGRKYEISVFPKNVGLARPAL